MSPEEEEKTTKEQLKRMGWRNPITFIAFFILITVVLLIAANVLGFDKGQTLRNLSNIEFARGLITYLFAVGTIGVIIIVILAILLSSEAIEGQIKRAKDVLTILIGLFGTIIGFYFGSQSGGKEAAPPASAKTELQFAPIQMPDSIKYGERFTVRTIVTGGSAPYEYWVICDSLTIHNQTINKIEAKVFVGESSDKSILVYAKDQFGLWGIKEMKVPINED